MKMQAFKYMETKIIIKKIFITLFPESFKRTGYDHLSVSGLSKRFLDLR